MIYTEQDLNIGANAFDIINESAWVDGTSIISPNTIPMVESSDIGGVVVRFSDVEALSEEYGVDYIDSMLAIAESNDLDPQYMAVTVDESELIVNPELIYELANVVVAPQSENSLAYQFCEACIDAYAESGDEDYLWIMINEDFNDYKKELMDDIKYHGDIKNITKKQIKNLANRKAQQVKNFVNKHPGAIAGALFASGLGVAGSSGCLLGNPANPKAKKFDRLATGLIYGSYGMGGYTLKKYIKGHEYIDEYEKYKTQPRNVIAKKIASLRKLYKYWLFKAKRERDDGRASMIKQILVRITETIDKLLLLLQRGANAVSDYMYNNGNQ